MRRTFFFFFLAGAGQLARCIDVLLFSSHGVRVEIRSCHGVVLLRQQPDTGVNELLPEKGDVFTAPGETRLGIDQSLGFVLSLGIVLVFTLFPALILYGLQIQLDDGVI